MEVYALAIETKNLGTELFVFKTWEAAMKYLFDFAWERSGAEIPFGPAPKNSTETQEGIDSWFNDSEDYYWLERVDVRN